MITQEPRTCRRVLAAALLLGLAGQLAVSGAAHGANARSLAAEVTAAHKKDQALAKRRWNASEETRLVDAIDEAADHFHQLASSGARIPRTAQRLLRLIEGVRERYTSALEAMQDEVIRADGDLEAVQDSAPWRERELLAMRLLYRLNWVRYEIATRYEPSTSRRAALLRRARDGFTEFLAAGDRTLTIESLLGHGLASKTLKDYDTAVRDFQDALGRNPDAETTVALRLALAEVYLTLGRIGNALAETKRLTSMRVGRDVQQVRFLRAKALMLAVGKYRKNYSASTRGTFRQEAAVLLEKLYGSGDYWKNKVVQLIDAGIETPLEWTAASTSPFVKFLIASSLRRRGDCDEAVVLYSALLEQNRFVSESHYGIGFCAFYEGRYEEAIRELSRFFDASGSKEAFAGQASYLRFKAAESLYLKQGDEGDGVAAERYLAFLTDFLERAPEHPNAYEAWFRLGEWHRDRREYVQAAQAFAKVRGDLAFHLKASFQSAQSYFQAVLEQSEPGKTPEVGLVKTALSSLDRFVQEARAFRENRTAGSATEKLTDPLRAKAVTMAAGICAHLEDGMHERLRRLAGFEERFPDQSDLFAEVSSLRIVAYRRIGDLAAAGAELEKVLARGGKDVYTTESLRKFGVMFLKEAAEREQAGDTAAAVRARTTALRIYERLLSRARADRDGDEASASERAMEKLVADLRAQVDR